MILGIPIKKDVFGIDQKPGFLESQNLSMAIQHLMVMEALLRFW